MNWLDNPYNSWTVDDRFLCFLFNGRWNVVDYLYPVGPFRPEAENLKFPTRDKAKDWCTHRFYDPCYPQSGRGEKCPVENGV